MKTSTRLATVLRWAARLLGCALVTLVAMIAIGEGMPNPLTQPPAVQVGFLAMALLLAGMLVAWRWELTGAVVSLGGWCLFMGAVVPAGRMNWFVGVLAIPGLLYLGSALIRRRLQRLVA
jgi:hypothetical protein